MKKLITATLAAATLGAPAFAATITISFANDNGETVTMSFDDETMTATVDGVDGSFDYTFDEATRTICGNYTGEGESCATFAEVNETPAIGDTSAYTTNDGGSGTATITALAE